MSEGMEVSGGGRYFPAGTGTTDIGFGFDSNNGLYQSASNLIDISANSTKTFEFASTGNISFVNLVPSPTATLTLGTSSLVWDTTYTTNINNGASNIAISNIMKLTNAQSASGAKTFTGGLIVSTANMTITNVDVVLNATTGTKFATATTQKLSFWNATPITQPTSGTDILQVLQNTGLCATGALSTPLDLGGGTLSAGAISMGGNITLGNGNNIVIGTGSGTKIGTGTTQKIGFFNATPVVQQTQGATVTNNVTAGGTANTIANFTDLSTYANDAATIRNDIYQLTVLMKTVIDALRTYGLLS